MPLVKSDSVKVNAHTLWLNEDGTISNYSTTDGGGAFYMSTTTQKKHFIVDGIKTGANAILDVKCSTYNKGDTIATLVVKANGTQLATATIGLDERHYLFQLPALTSSIDLSQEDIGSKAKGYHRISLQQVFVYQGDYREQHQSLAGYPKTIDALEYRVDVPLTESDVYYYSVLPRGQRQTNIVRVSGDKIPVDDALETVSSQFTYRSEGQSVVLENIGTTSQLYIIDIQGRLLYSVAHPDSEVQRLFLPARGIYIVKTDNAVHKIVL